MTQEDDFLQESLILLDNLSFSLPSLSYVSFVLQRAQELLNEDIYFPPDFGNNLDRISFLMKRSYLIEPIKEKVQASLLVLQKFATHSLSKIQDEDYTREVIVRLCD